MDNYDVTYYKIDIEIDILLEFIESEITMQALICEDQTTEIEMNFTIILLSQIFSRMAHL